MSHIFWVLSLTLLIMPVALQANPPGDSAADVTNVAATSEQNARFVHCISKKYELVVDLSQSDLNHRLLKNVSFAVRSGPGAYKKEHAFLATLHSDGTRSVFEFVGSRGTHVELMTPDFIFGEALVRDWDLGCDFYQNYGIE